MRVVICEDARQVGRYAAAEVAAALNQAIGRPCGPARLLLSTGESQFETLSELVRKPVAWERVEAFHLDEYIGLAPDHPASFRHYLRQRVADLVPLPVHYLDPSSRTALGRLAELLSAAPVDVGLVGVGENGHIAFNDPPADFSAVGPYIEVTLAASCRAQQVREGWFSRLEDVPERALTMSVKAIMSTRKIVSAVPHEAKADAVRRLLCTDAVSPELPASVLKEHPDATLVLDRGSSRALPQAVWARCTVL
jgi:glucosamine-6-phosphate deaminase